MVLYESQREVSRVLEQWDRAQKGPDEFKSCSQVRAERWGLARGGERGMSTSRKF